MSVRAAIELRDAAEVQALLEGLTQACEAQLRRKLVSVPLYSSGVRYRREPTGREQWQTAAETLRLREGDCEDLVAWRVAELRGQGEAARPHVYSPRPGLLHCVVRRANGTLECPSTVLGMGRP